MWCSQRQPLVRGLAPWLAYPSFESPCLTVAVVSVGRASFVSCGTALPSRDSAGARVSSLDGRWGPGEQG